MEHISPHGFVFVALQLAIVLALHWGLFKWHSRATPKRPVERVAGAPPAADRVRSAHAIPMLAGLGFVAWYLVLRIQPARMGGDSFAYSLGVFDGVSITGLSSLVLLHTLFSWRDSRSMQKEQEREGEEGSKASPREP